MYLQFENAVYLWFLLTIPLFIITHFWFLKNSKAKAMKFANFEALKRISGGRILTSNMTHLVIRAIIMFSLIAAASGATLWYEGYNNEVNFVLAIDTSASMTSKDVTPNRLDAAKEYAQVFMEDLDSYTEIGLVSFAGTSIVESPLTDDKGEIILKIESISISKTGGTDIPGAIITGTNLLLAKPDKGKTIILVSDGVNTLGAFISDSVKQSIRYARENQVIINTIGIGTDTGPLGYLPEYYNISSNYDEGVLKTIATETGGTYVYAATTEELRQAYKEFTKDTKEGFIPIKIGEIALILAIALLFFEWTIANTMYRRIV